MTIREEGIDSKILRWSGFAIAAFIVSALTIGGGQIVSPAPTAPTLTRFQIEQDNLMKKTNPQTFVLPAKRV